MRLKSLFGQARICRSGDCFADGVQVPKAQLGLVEHEAMAIALGIGEHAVKVEDDRRQRFGC